MFREVAFQYSIDSNTLSFYGWWQFSVCIFAFAALIGIWWHIGRKKKDFGQVWLAISVLCWSFSGAVEVYHAHQTQKTELEIHQKIESILSPSTIDMAQLTELKSVYDRLKENQTHKSYKIDGWRSIFSLCNSLFILLALPWFRYIPNRIEPIIKSNYWPYIIGLPFLFSLLPTINKLISKDAGELVSELDVYYATLTLVFLGFVLWESFAKRRLKILAYLSVVCIVITFAAQLYKLTSSDINLILFSAIFKTSLIMIFFALALSWVKELAENILPSSDKLHLTLDRIKTEQGKYQNLVLVKGIPGQGDRSLSLTPALFELLLKFANGKVQGEGWLEIKPKGDSHPITRYDINDHNEIKRLIHALLDGIFGSGAWTRDQHEQPLRNTLFEMSEKRERKIRLRLPVQNITLLNL